MAGETAGQRPGVDELQPVSVSSDEFDEFLDALRMALLMICHWIEKRKAKRRKV